MEEIKKILKLLDNNYQNDSEMWKNKLEKMTEIINQLQN